MPTPGQTAGPSQAGNPGSGSGEGAKPAGSFATNLVQESQAGSGGAQASPAPAQGGQDQAAAAQGAKATELPGWTNATTKELRADPRFSAFAAKYKSFDEAVKSALELEAKAGTMVSLPTDKSSPEEVADFYERFGVPKTPEGYELEKDKGLEYTDESLKEFRAMAHGLHLTKDQAKEMFRQINASAAKTLKEYGEKQRANEDAAAAACEGTLKKAWAEGYAENLEVAKRGMGAFATADLLKEAERTGMGNSPAFLQLFFELGKTVREDSSVYRPAHGKTPKAPEDILYPSKK